MVKKDYFYILQEEYYYQPETEEEQGFLDTPILDREKPYTLRQIMCYDRWLYDSKEEKVWLVCAEDKHIVGVTIDELINNWIEKQKTR